MKAHEFQLRYKLPYDFEALLSWFRFHQIPGIEQVDGSSYSRVISSGKGLGWLRVVDDKRGYLLRVNVSGVAEKDLPGVEARVRRMFDVDADPRVIASAMGRDDALEELWARHPGLRVARAWSSFESTITTILGQLVAVSFGRILVHELMTVAGAKAKHPQSGNIIHLFPTPQQLMSADLSKVRTSAMRRKSILAVTKAVSQGAFDWQAPIDQKTLRKTLLSIPGIGAWTAEYVAMRGFDDDDAFPATDYGLKRELERYPQIRVERVRPLRAYAAAALWRSYGDAKKAAMESASAQ